MPQDTSQPKPSRHGGASALIFIGGMLGFVLVLNLTAETECREVGIVAAALLWGVSAVVGVLTIPRRLWGTLRGFFARNR